MNAITVSFDDIEYRMSHGKAPRGRGSWAFGFRRSPKPWNTLTAPANLTYTEAKENIRQQVKERGLEIGHYVLYTQP